MSARECKYNSQVDCSGEQRCKKCGWNPEVDKKRKSKIKKKIIKETKWIVGETKKSKGEEL